MLLRFMHIASKGDNLHETIEHIFGKNKNKITNLSFAEFAQRVVKVNYLAFVFES